MRLLIPLDGSPLAEQALDPARQMFAHAASDSTVTLYRVVRYPALAIDMQTHGSSFARAALLDEALDASRDYLRTVANWPDFAAIDVDYAADDGEPADLIVQEAQRVGADYLLMMSHGRSGISRLVLGSVAEAVARKSTTPTIILRAERPTILPDEQVHPFTVAVFLDGTPASEAMIDPAAKLANMFRGELRLVMVLPEHETRFAMQQRVEQTHAYLAPLHQRLELRGIPTSREVLWGEPVEQIVSNVQQHHTDVIAMATHGTSSIEEWLHHERAFDVMRKVAVPMLLMHLESHDTPAQ